MGKLSSSQIKFIKSLSRSKERDAAGVFVVEGEKMVDEALKSSFEVAAVYKRDDIGEETMGRISSLSTPSPVLAVVKKPLTPEKVSLPAKGLYLILDSVRDPGNLGTILRICDWFGVDGIYASSDTVDIYNPKVVQASMGAIFRVRFIYCDLPATLSAMRGRGIPVYGTFLEGDDIYKSSLTKGGVIVMGSESNGIGPDVEALVDRKLYIPPFPPEGTGSESLNVAIATAITCSEFRRR